MTDLKTMMDTLSLNSIKTEIDSQFSSIENHGNEMKLAIMLSFLLEDSVEALKKIDISNFLDQLQTELKDKINQVEHWDKANNLLREHLTKNQELLTQYERFESDVAELTLEINNCLERYDNVLRRAGLERCRQSIAEIEATKSAYQTDI